MSTSISRRTAQVPIYQGDDVSAIDEALAEYNRAESFRQLAEAQKRASQRLNDPLATAEVTKAAREAAKAYDDVKADALPRAIMATVTALGRKTWRKVLAEHPPREDNESDRNLGFNEATFFDAILEFWDVETGERSITGLKSWDEETGEHTKAEPDFGSKNALVAWLDDLSDGVFTELSYKALNLNQGGSPDPKASLGLQAEQMYAVTSQSHGSTD